MRWRLRMRSIRGQLLALFAVLLLAGAAVLVLDEVAQYRARQSLESLQAESLGRLRALKAVDDGYKLGVVDVTFKVRNYLLDWDDGVAALDRARESIDANWRKLRDMPHLPRQEALVLEAAQARERADHAADTLRAILLKQDIGELGRFADTELYPAVDPVSERLQALSDLAMVDAEATVRADVRRAWYTSALRIGLSLLAFLVAAIAGRRILSNAYRGIEALTRLAQRMREHDYVAPPGPRPRGELGEVMDAFLDMRGDVLRFETELTEQLVRNEKVREELERATLAKSAFLAAMSHEIRTPMIGVTGMVEVLAHTRLDTEQRRALNIIQSSSNSLLQIIGDILDFSKIEAERMELHPVPTHLPRVLQAAVANFSGSASSKGLGLSCEIDERITDAHRVDPLRLRQVLSNFLSNAIKFTERGNVHAALAWRGSREQDGETLDRLCFSIADSGIGVDRETQARLFQPFAQADAQTTRRFGGTGLGLAISRELAALMGGEVTMESVPGVGTTLRLVLELPRAPLSEVAPEPATHGLATDVALRSLPSVEEAERERSLVLLVDDHPTNRTVIARQLALAGFASEPAEDGEAALEAWRSGRYALLLSDVHMPRMDGYALARRIREEEAARGLPRTPIVALTASALKGEAERCLGAGMDDYLAKPVSITALATTLGRWLLHLAPAAEAGATAGPFPQLAHPPPLDPAVLEGLTGGDPAEIRALLDDFLDSTRQDMSRLETARAAGDLPGIAREAHRLKGAARLVGALELDQCADQLEAAARAADWLGVPALVADLGTAAERLRHHVAERYPPPG
ncbi:ATP-binding protein [Luteimonas sp. 8-5]|uniref:ATP-binding protein n=1 Tax=Luteimonas sp. 8-5 TaxID=3039387 RepID=UPI00243677A7|nr:ATP-binding protein [Luteimonas sp. 8-5]MDG6347351.1 ATP-binding protein [Luteimonas sp. 8-5]